MYRFKTFGRPETVIGEIPSMKSDSYRGRALLYYKTDAFGRLTVGRRQWHTNVAEVPLFREVLNDLGFSVDVVDRSFQGTPPNAPYEIYFGLGSGYSGKNFLHFAEFVKDEGTFLLATGPRPDLADELVKSRYDYFNERHETSVPAMRTFPGLPIESFLRKAQGVLAIGDEGQFSWTTYANRHSRVASYLPSIPPQLMEKRWSNDSRDRRKFLCFAGSGFICKGVDLLVEAFARLPHLTLDICGPNSEKGFFETLGPVIDEHPNIRYHGFVTPSSRKFRHLVETCSFTVLAGSAEACATSVVTTMSTGLIPITTFATGVNLGDFGLLLQANQEHLILEIQEICTSASQMTEDEFEWRRRNLAQETKRYSHSAFRAATRQGIEGLLV